MTISSTEQVLFVWSVVGIYELLVTAYAVRRAWTDGPDRAVAWRKWKVTGAFLGAVGLTAGMFTFEKTSLELSQGVASFMAEEFLNLKLEATVARAVACSGDQTSEAARNECFDFSNLDRQTAIPNLHSDRPFREIKNWQNNPRLNELIARNNANANRWNQSARLANEKPLLSLDSRVKIGFLALFLIASAIACSIGESVYQWRQEVLRAGQKAAR
ncbi:hypothetical protein [Paracraurococcus lichenis]|uniref:Uncharacterized protein n=1 Tax=Paracraurococcus lichenis TaxID=3064888 RepID=A0ABT9ED19_9PROT|nr:hypothetical protein [Paracraurococcus sp. LOR1-02]MDO9713873.1 hypothetical protein [Paracraurococcus sp. LOR1-02]